LPPSSSTAISPGTSSSSASGAGVGVGAGVGTGSALVAAGAAGGWEYAPAPETARVTIQPRYGHFIGGAFTKPSGTFATVNPATEAVLSEVSMGTARDVDRAVEAARAALPAWAALPGVERAKHLFRIARRIQERARELAILETLDGGKPIKESRDVDVPLAAQHFFYHAGWADKLEYAFPGRTPEPLGVCAQIIPWNFPLLMAAWKIAPALACGNTVVIKPAETTPLTLLRLAEIFEEVGLPPGVVNVVTGDGSTGAALAAHPGVNKVAFTGSTEVGKRIAQSAAERGVPVTLELGGKSPNIVFEDAALDQAIEGIISGIYFNQGHVCCAGSRLLVQESVANVVAQKLSHRMASLRVGDPMDKNTDVGAINSRGQLERITSFCQEASTSGAVRHEPTRGELPAKGYFMRPCFFTNVQPADRLAREEVFGPVLAVLTFRTPEEAITKANNTPYGLAAGVWTEKGSKILDVAARLKAGVVWCNTFNQFDAASPFGGYKESGFGREGGMQGLRAYVRL
jgi:aldehyde dehydrogenase (NAD+)